VNAHDLFHAGELREAVSAATDEVRQHPTDSGRRLLLVELLCFAGELERADNQLDTLGHNDPQTISGINVFRQLIRAEQARHDFFAEGRVPSLLDKPDGSVRLLLEASTRIREKALPEAVMLMEQAEDERPRVSGICDGQPFEDFRDLDDLASCILEVLTVKGDYYWIPIDRVESIEFREPERPRDLLWRRTHLVVSGGPDGEVYLPVLYPGAAREADDKLRLGRLTDWRGGDTLPVHGVGQRTFLVGEDARPILELKSLTFDRPEPVTNPPEPAAG
jgi:type VI secretion system protein ImpE